MSVLDPYSEAVIGAAVEAALKPLLNATASIVSPSAEYIGKRVHDWCQSRVEALCTRTMERVKATGRERVSVAPKIGVRIVEGYVLEDDAFLQEDWAGLMASAAVDPGAVLPAFPEILRNLSGDDARLLDALYTESFASASDEAEFKTKGFYSTHVRNIFAVHVMQIAESSPDSDDLYTRLGTACQNLIRLRLVTDETKDGMSLTIIGYRFVRACRGPRPTPAQI